ncbi:hypothetical protein MP228_000930 [Amoeboaphelidium protococcarum]|nr:hypothetical protein MP228_000930 [Amoeboaphelidium protococcarum]
MVVRGLIRPTIFAVTSSTVIYGSAVYLDIVQSVRDFSSDNYRPNGDRSWPRWKDLQNYMTLKTLFGSMSFRSIQLGGNDTSWRRLWHEKVESSIVVPSLLKDYSHIMVDKWADADEYKRLAAGIIAVNALVFIGWRVPIRRFQQRIMQKYFLDNVASSSPSALLGSSWSHISFLHLAFNMYALSSFMPHVLEVMSKHHHRHIIRQDPSSSDSIFSNINISGESLEGLAFYTSAGIWAALLSRSFKTLLASRYTHFVSQGSLGASGALYAVLTYTALTSSPNTMLSVIFLPGLSLPILTGYKCLIAFDSLMLARIVLSRGTAMSGLDHAAHLGGAVFGYLYWRNDSQYGDDRNIIGGELWKSATQQLYKISKVFHQSVA